MTALLEKAPDMSVAHRSSVRPHGLDRLIMRVSLMMLLAARRHAQRAAVTYDEHTRRREAARAVERRELGAARFTARTF